MDPLLELRHVTKEFRAGPETVRALDKVTLDIFAGDYLVVRGPSGSGKSVLLSLLGLLDEPSSGILRILGQDVHRLADEDLARLRNRRIGMIFQHSWMLPRRSVAENVALPLRYRGIPPTRALARAKDALERVGIIGSAGRRAGELSGGQLQLAGLARALVGEPDLILADEPTASLDPKSEEHVLQTLADFHKNHHLTVVHVAHRISVPAGRFRELGMEGGRSSEKQEGALSSAARRDQVTP